MKIAVIDMGTNTFHLLLAEVRDGVYRVLHKDRIAVRIGAGGISEGVISEEAIIRALSALKGFREKIDEHQIEKVFATATSAVRSASNGAELVRRIKEAVAIDVRIITGDQEAEAIYYGVSQALELGSNTSLIMDVGGGSIEFIIGNDKEILWKQSFEMGGQRLLDQFHQTDPIDQAELNSLNAYIQENLKPLIEACDKFNPRILVGSSGTFDTLSDIYREKEGIMISAGATEYPLTVLGFQSIFEDLKSMDREERLRIPGMIEMRVDMIVVASVLVNFIIQKMSIEHIRVSSYALKEGILMQTIASLEAQKV